MTSSQKPFFWSVLFGLLLFLTLFLMGVLRTALGQDTIVSGWLLFGMIAFLTLFHARKKIPVPPLGSVKTWLNLHLFLGCFSVALFFIHTRFAWPNGFLERSLTLLFLTTGISGIVGWILSRRIPKQLTTRGGEVIFERIPFYRHCLKAEFEECSLCLAATERGSLLSEHIQTNVYPFMLQARNFLAHLTESRRPLEHLLLPLQRNQRYLNPQELEVIHRLVELVKEKDRLDYHLAKQKILKGWLFVHIPLTYATWVFIVIHVLTVFQFSAGGAV